MNILQEIITAIQRHAMDDPVVVFDLDSTLFSTRERTFKILQEAVDRFPELGRALAKVDAYTLGWEFWHDLQEAGVTDDNALRGIRDFWHERFFTSDYLVHDRPMPGAVEYVNAVFRAGGIVCYLTGRDQPVMGAGTIDSLRRHGLPFDEPRVELILKANAKQSDQEHKRLAVERVHALGTVVAAFDNEPELVNLFVDEFPDALVVLYDSIHSPTGIIPYPGIPRITSFKFNGA